MLRSLLSTWPLFFGLLLIMIGNGLLQILLGLRAAAADLSNLGTGFMMGGYFLGVFLGSIFVPRILSNVGHIRTFGALSAVASAAALVHVITDNAAIWAFMRLLTGFTYAGMYIVVESWLNEKATNQTRGQILSIYMVITMGGMGLGQVMGGFDDGVTSVLFIIASVFVSIAVVPILVTAGQAPEFSAPEQVSLRRLYSISPLAMVGMLFQGVSTAMTFGMGTAYAKSIGMTSSQASLFLVAVTIGTMLLQYPVGRLSDVLDRRLVIFLVAMISATAAAAATFFSAEQFWPLITLTAIYGGFSMTIYSLCIAHANDYLTPSQMVGTASTLIMVNGIGAIVGSPLIAVFMDLLSNRAYFIGLAIIHVTTGIYALARMKARAPVPAEAQGPFIAVPEAGTAIAATLNPEAAWDDITEDDDLATGILSANPYLELPPQTDNN